MTEQSTDGTKRTATVETLPDDHADPEKFEYRVECEENCQRGPVCWADAQEWIDEHEGMGHDLTVFIREKKSLNDSDFARMPDNECRSCGADNVPGQVICAVCGESMVAPDGGKYDTDTKQYSTDTADEDGGSE